MVAVVGGAGWVTAGGLGGAYRHTGCALTPGPLPACRGAEVLRRPCPRFARFDAFSRQGMAAVSFALEDAGLADWQEKRPFGIVAATVLGCLEVDTAYYASALDGDGSAASPNLFTYTLPNCFLGEAAAHFGLRGPAYVLTLAPGAGLGWLEAALELLADAAVPLVIAGCNEGALPGVCAGPRSPVPGAAFLVLANPVAAGLLPRPLGRLRAAGGACEYAGAAVADLAALLQAVMAVAAATPMPYEPACPALPSSPVPRLGGTL